MNFSIDIGGLQRAAEQVGEIGQDVGTAINGFVDNSQVPDLFGTDSPLAEVGNRMYAEGMIWMTECLRSLESAFGDHAVGLGRAAQGFAVAESDNIRLAELAHPVGQALGTFASSLPQPWGQIVSGEAPIGGEPEATPPPDQPPAPPPEDTPPPEDAGAPAPSPTPATDAHSTITYEATPEVKQWIAEARAIMIADGVDPALIDANDLAIIAMHESGGDPNAQNDWDINAQNGTPSIGLMQTIGPTFDAHAMPGHTDITNPVDNIIAASRYAIDRYGSVSAAPGPASVNNGGPYQPY